jgi:hypothetical protein
MVGASVPASRRALAARGDARPTEDRDYENKGRRLYNKPAAEKLVQEV